MNDIKEVMPYVALADNLEYSNQVLAYYLRKYASGRAYQIYQNLTTQNPPAAQEIYGYLESMMKKTEDLSKMLGGQIDLKANITEILTYTEKIFLHADDEYRAGRITPELTQSFQTAWRFYEVINFFAKLSEDQDKRRLYAKAKAVEVHKKLKAMGGEQPPSQPQSYQTPPQLQPQLPAVKPSPPQHQPGNKKKQLDPQRIAVQENAVLQIQNAISELSFNRAGYAKENMKKALLLLERY